MRIRVATLVLFILVVVSATAFGQLEAGGGYTHMTGNNGTDGFSGTVGWQFNRRVTLVGDGDFMWDTSKAGVFELVPSVGALRIKSNLQNYLGGARIGIFGWKAMKSVEKHKLRPFGEVLIGVSRLHQSVSDTQGTISASASDTAFTWLLGGGVDYTLSKKWVARGSADLVRTHFVDAGQSSLKIHLGIAYLF
jgi:opacity protein-like surface antigen